MQGRGQPKARSFTISYIAQLAGVRQYNKSKSDDLWRSFKVRDHDGDSPVAFLMEMCQGLAATLGQFHIPDYRYLGGWGNWPGLDQKRNQPENTFQRIVDDRKVAQGPGDQMTIARSLSILYL